MRFVDYVVVVVLSGVVGLLAGASAAGRIDGDEVTAKDLAAVRDRVRQLEGEDASETFGQPRLADLEARVAALEGAPIREGAPAPEAWSDADVAALRVGLEKVRRAEQEDRDAQRLRQVVQRIVPDAEPAVRDETVARLLEAIRDARADPEQAEALRAAVLEELAAVFPDPIAGRLAGLVPVGEAPEGAR